ncbi:MAG: hypothetical protein FWC95_05795 [Defluviitaleaceae bacterium]|nr:hypothetical protein [Defluviitaleaceae bacterium]
MASLLKPTHKTLKKISLLAVFRAFALFIVGGAAFLGISRAFFYWQNINYFPEINKLFHYFHVYVIIYPELSTHGNFSFFIERVVVYSQPILAIWFLAFFPPVTLLAFGLLFLEAMGIAFTAAMLWQVNAAHGASGFAAIWATFWPLVTRVTLILPMLAYVTVASARQAAERTRLHYLLKNKRTKKERRYSVSLPGSRVDYVQKLLLCLLAATIAAFAEAFLLR